MIDFDVMTYWQETVSQNAAGMRPYFTSDALIYWCGTHEKFTVDEFISANCEYPGNWTGTVENCIMCGETLVTVVRIESMDENQSYHVVSFFKFKRGLIDELKEYWAEIGEPPEWRMQMQIGTRI